MAPWELKIGQVVGYKPRGDRWRARVTAMVDRDGKPFLAEIPVMDENGESILYEDPPAYVNPIIDYENYYLVEDLGGSGTDPWLAARLDHQDVGLAWKAFAERIGIKDPYYQAMATIMEKWIPEGSRGDFTDDLLVLLHAAWRAGRYTENQECSRLLKRRCDERGAICLGNCTHSDDVKAIEKRLWDDHA